MVNATVDNSPVTVLLEDSETYTPSTGSVQKVAVSVHPAERLDIIVNGTSNVLVDNNTGTGEPNVSTLEMVLTDNTTLKSQAKRPSAGIYISGFEVS